MKYFTLSVLCATLFLTSSQCDKTDPPDPPNGHLKLTVTYPEIIIENDTVYYIHVPGFGAEARLFDKDARCKGYTDAKLGIAFIGDEPVFSKYEQYSNEKGEVLFKDIPAEEYFLIVCARQLHRYTEKYIKVNGGDTLKLKKDFTPDGSFYEDLEPWDYEVP